MAKLNDLIEKHWSKFSPQLSDVPDYVHTTFKKILACRTEKLGCHCYQCPECGHIHIVKHSCKNRFCSSCGTSYTDAWTEKAVSMLSSIKTQYYFVTFTIPKELEQLGLLCPENKKLILNILFQSSWWAVATFFKKEKKVIPGMISQLHTAGRWLNWHPHIHAVCTYGGLSMDGTQWNEVYMSAKAVGDFFKLKFLRSLRKAYKSGDLKTNFGSYKEFNVFLDEQYRKHWQFDRSDLIDRITATIRYISRYMLKPPISDNRIVWFNFKQVCFTFTDYKTDLKAKGFLPTLEFFQRLIWHVPIPRFARTRSYGIFSTRTKTDHLAKAKELIPAPNDMHQFHDQLPTCFRERTKLKTGKDPLLCPDCQTEMKELEVFYPNQLDMTFAELVESLKNDSS